MTTHGIAKAAALPRGLVSRAALVLTSALWLAGCSSLPFGSKTPEPQAPPPRPVVQAPVEPEPPEPDVGPAVQERALASDISRTYLVANQRASHIVRVASDASGDTGLPRTLILAVIAVESSFNPQAVSPKGARGLMQVLPQAHPRKVERIGGVHMLHDVEAGIRVGSRILHEYRRVTGNLQAALKRYSGSARNYAAKVFRHKARFDMVEATGAPPLTLQSPWDDDDEIAGAAAAISAQPTAIAPATLQPPGPGDAAAAPRPSSPPIHGLDSWGISSLRRPDVLRFGAAAEAA